MKIFLAVLIMILGCQPTWAAPDPEIKEGSVVVVPIDGQVSKAQFLFLRRVLKEAEEQKAAGFIIDMDTYGGELGAAVQMLNLLLKATMPTATYVDSNAGSAGALIALATRKVYMAPVSAIGAAAPVSGGGAEVPETMNAKIVSYFSGYFRSAAEVNGYNPEIAEAFINKEKEVKIGEEVISPQGSLLTLSAQEATKKYDGKPLLATGIAPSIEDVVKEMGLAPDKIVRIEPSGFEKIAQWITVLAPLFLLGGIIGAYLEFKSPGFGVAGFLSACCFLIFFTGHYIAGLTGFEVIAVFAVGVLLVVAELIFFPGILIMAALGVALMLGAVLFAMTDIYPGQPLTVDPEAFVAPLLNLTIAVGLSGAVIALLARFLPELPIFRRLMLQAAVPSGSSVSTISDLSPAEREPALGEVGVTRSILRPAGKVDFANRTVDATTLGEFIPAGSKVKVVQVQDSHVIVEQV